MREYMITAAAAARLGIGNDFLARLNAGPIEDSDSG